MQTVDLEPGPSRGGNREASPLSPSLGGPGTAEPCQAEPLWTRDGPGADKRSRQQAAGSFQVSSQRALSPEGEREGQEKGIEAEERVRKAE